LKPAGLLLMLCI